MVKMEQEAESPRFTEARKRCGIRKRELEEKVFDDFEQNGLHEEIQRIRFEHYERKREEKIRSIQRMRERVIQEASLAAAGGNIQDRHASDDIAMIEKERAQLRRVEERQRQEIERMMSNEMKIADQLAEKERREIEDERRKKDLREQREAKQKAEEMRRAQLERDQLQHEKEEARKLRLMLEKEAQERRIQAKREEEREKEMRRQARERERIREQKQADLKEQTARLFDLQQKRIEKKLKLLEEKDAERLSALEEKRKQMAFEQSKKKELQTHRVQRARKNQEEKLLRQQKEFSNRQERATQKQLDLERQREMDRQMTQKRSEYKEKMIQQTKHQMELRLEEKRRKAEERKDHIAHKLRQLEVHKEMQVKHKAAQERDREEKRQKAYNQMVALERKRIEGIHNKQIQREEMAAIRASQDISHDLADEIARLREEDRLETIERKKRADEYERKRLLAKVARNEERGNIICQHREMLVRKRREQRDKSMLQKKVIVDAFEKMKETGRLKFPRGFEVSESLSALAKGVSTSPHRPHTSSRPKTATTLARKPLNQEREEIRSARSASPRSQHTRYSEGKTERKRPETKAKKLRREIELLRREQNEFLLRVLEEEQSREEKRESRLKNVTSKKEQIRLSKRFGIERGIASEKILRLTKEHEEILNFKVNELNGLINAVSQDKT